MISALSWSCQPTAFLGEMLDATNVDVDELFRVSEIDCCEYSNLQRRLIINTNSLFEFLQDGYLLHPFDAVRCCRHGLWLDR